VLEPSRRVLGDDPYLLALLGFVDQEQGRFDAAGRLAEQALAAEPTSVTAAHLQAHVNLEVADHEHGLRWLDAFHAGMAPDSDYHHHVGWHAALHALALGDLASTRQRLVALAAPSTDTVRQVVDTGTLLLRCRLCGVVGAEQDPTEGRGGTPSAVMLADPTSMYLAFQVAVGLAVQRRADDLRELARRAPGMTGPGVAAMLPDLARALADWVEGSHDRAADALAALRPASYRWGGSRAQRDVVEDVLIDAALRAGRVELARAVLTERLQRRPNRWDASALEAAVWHPVR
jgi:tetratricopeptide (TPR) repeat protein